MINKISQKSFKDELLRKKTDVKQDSLNKALRVITSKVDSVKSYADKRGIIANKSGLGKKFKFFVGDNPGTVSIKGKPGNVKANLTFNF